MTLAAKYYIDMLKGIHATEVDDGEVPDMKETALAWADFVAAHLPEDQAKKLRALIEAVPKRNTLMHGDYHTNNIMVQNGDLVLFTDVAGQTHHYEVVLLETLPPTATEEMITSGFALSLYTRRQQPRDCSV